MDGNIRGPSVETMVKRLHISKTAATAIKRRMQSGDVDGTLDLADTILNAYGVESVQHPSIWVDRYYGSIGLLYVNKGEIYHTTLCYDTQADRFLICSWGDWVEKNLNLDMVYGNRHIYDQLTSAKPKKSTKQKQKTRRR